MEVATKSVTKKPKVKLDFVVDAIMKLIIFAQENLNSISEI